MSNYNSLKEMTNSILNSMDSLEVNSIEETEEAMQVANIIRQTAEDLFTLRNWEGQKRLFQLQPPETTERPNYLRLPDNVKQTEWIRYDIGKIPFGKKDFVDLIYMHPDDFIKSISTRRVTDQNRYEFDRSVPGTINPQLGQLGLIHPGIRTIYPRHISHPYGYFGIQDDKFEIVKDFSGIELIIRNNRNPTYWTSFDDKHIVTDSYNMYIEDTIQANKTQCFGFVVNTFRWEHRDDFVPEMTAEELSLLRNNAKTLCFYEIKQMGHEIAAQQAAYMWRRTSSKNWRANQDMKWPNYGRRPRKYGHTIRR